jgi:hypothetical protein
MKSPVFHLVENTNFYKYAWHKDDKQAARTTDNVAVVKLLKFYIFCVASVGASRPFDEWWQHDRSQKVLR